MIVNPNLWWLECSAMSFATGQGFLHRQQRRAAIATGVRAFSIICLVACLWLCPVIALRPVTFLKTVVALSVVVGVNVSAFVQLVDYSAQSCTPTGKSFTIAVRGVQGSNTTRTCKAWNVYLRKYFDPFKTKQVLH